MENLLSNLTVNKIYSATTIHSGTNSKANRTERKLWAVLIKYEGETEYNCYGKKIISNINNPVILPKGSSYDWVCTKSGNYTIIEFDSELTYDKILSFKISNPEGLLNLFKGIEFRNGTKKPSASLKNLRDLYKIIITLQASIKKNYLPSKKQDKIQPATEYIAKNISQKFSNDSLAELCGISTVYFRKLFTAVYGVSPIDYVKQLRIKKAKEMLRSDFGSISDVAISLGYSSLYDFPEILKSR